MKTKTLMKTSYIFVLTVVLGYITGLMIETSFADNSKLSTLIDTGKFDSRWIPFSNIMELANIDLHSYATNDNVYSFFFKDAYLEITPLDAVVQFVISSDKKIPDEGHAFFVNRISECIVKIDNDVPDAECVICALQDDYDSLLSVGQEEVSGISAGEQFTITWDEFLNDDEYITDVRNVDGVLVGVCVPKGEGCTPGYWKNHLNAWPQPYDPDDLFVDAFVLDVDQKQVIEDSFGTGYTLNQALNQGGGNLNSLVRHATAALLSAQSNEVAYTIEILGTDGILDLVQDTLDGISDIEDTKDIFEEANEMGCPL